MEALGASHHLPRRPVGGDGARALTEAARDEAASESEVVRLRTENLALKVELIELKLAAINGVPREPGDAGSALRALTDELRGAAASMEEAGVSLRRMALRSERLAEALRERERVAAEMSHRVKNDLQLVAALLRTQAAGQRNPEAARALGIARARVEVVARVHGLLCDADGSGTIEFARYLRETCAALSELLGADGRRRALVVRADPAVLPADTARSLGMVVNELVTNAFRHAFGADGTGTVWVEFARDADGRLGLTVADDGAGLPEDPPPGGLADRAGAAGLGLRLVAMTARQLGAEFIVGRGSGTHITLTLPATEPAGSS